MTMTELVYARILFNQYYIFLTNGIGQLDQGGMPAPTTWLWVPTSPITVLAIHSIASSVKCYGPRPLP